MSVIAWDGRTLAADKRASFGTTIRTTTKIFRSGDALVAYAGDAAFGEEVRAWFDAGAVAKDFPASNRDKEDWAGLLVIRRGQPIARYERTPFPVLFEDGQFSIGSGRDYALAAMYLGKTAREAVEVAIALDSGCGNGVDTLEFEKAEIEVTPEIAEARALHARWVAEGGRGGPRHPDDFVRNYGSVADKADLMRRRAAAKKTRAA